MLAINAVNYENPGVLAQKSMRTTNDALLVPAKLVLSKDLKEKNNFDKLDLCAAKSVKVGQELCYKLFLYFFKVHIKVSLDKFGTMFNKNQVIARIQSVVWRIKA